ncbi:MAG: D-aminoacyl-tRNA deacylase [Clostridia bacterium]|nr:D-aminoacyl-tRNA deacylase [Clostridia bacterium]
MRAVIQRVKTASVTIDGEMVSSIGRGLLVLLSVGDGDDERDGDYIADKVCGLRIFEDEHGKMNLSVEDAGGEVLLVSQFTLHGDARKGRRPSFIAAARPETAIPLYEYVMARLGAVVPVRAGRFAAEMDVALVNDGPVTILLDSKRTF